MTGKAASATAAAAVAVKRLHAALCKGHMRGARHVLPAAKLGYVALAAHLGCSVLPQPMHHARITSRSCAYCTCKRGRKSSLCRFQESLAAANACARSRAAAHKLPKCFGLRLYEASSEKNPRTCVALACCTARSRQATSSSSAAHCTPGSGCGTLQA